LWCLPRPNWTRAVWAARPLERIFEVASKRAGGCSGRRAESHSAAFESSIRRGKHRRVGQRMHWALSDHCSLPFAPSRLHRSHEMGRDGSRCNARCCMLWLHACADRALASPFLLSHPPPRSHESQGESLTCQGESTLAVTKGARSATVAAATCSSATVASTRSRIGGHSGSGRSAEAAGGPATRRSRSSSATESQHRSIAHAVDQPSCKEASCRCICSRQADAARCSVSEQFNALSCMSARLFA
jgi:hypothetical protein